MQKRGAVLAVLLILAATANAAWGAGVSLTVKAGLFFPSDAIFKDVYKNVTFFGGELAIPLAGGLHIWAGAEYFGDTGILPVTLEETKLRITPVFAGLRYHFGKSAVKPYIGAAGALFLFKEENPIGSVSENGLGVLGQGGILFKLGGPVGLDAFVNYRACTLKTDGEDPLQAKIGGLSAGLGLVIRF
jgi:hypothetical protein